MATLSRAGWALLVVVTGSTTARAADAVELGAIEDPLGIGCSLADPVGLRVSYGLFGGSGWDPVAVLFDEGVTAPSGEPTVIVVGPEDADFAAVAAALVEGADPSVSFGVRVEMVPPDSPPGSGCLAGGFGPGLAVPLPDGADVEWLQLELPAFSFVQGAPGYSTVEPWDARLRVSAWGTVSNEPPPVAEAGPDQGVIVGDAVALDGSASWDPTGGAVGYAWTLVDVPWGSTAWLDRADTAWPGFVADVPGAYRAELVVYTDHRESAPDQVVVVAENHAPVADAGEGVTVGVGEIVKLDGTGSADPDGHALAWWWTFAARPAGSYAGFDDPMSPTPSFVADAAGTFVLALVVSDGWDASAPAYVAVEVTNEAPVAVLGVDAEAYVGDLVVASSSESWDPDGDWLGRTWTLVAPAGSAAAIGPAGAAEVSFRVDVPGDYDVGLTVTDRWGATDEADAVVHVPDVGELLDEAVAVVNAAPVSAFARGKRAAVLVRIGEIRTAWERGSPAAAGKVDDLLRHVDGCVDAAGTADPGDWIVGCATQVEVHELLDAVRGTMG